VGIVYSLPGLLVAIIFHELAHGYTAFILGDRTAKDAGRLTLNPIKHIDVMGFIFMLIFKFGWAKPVPINPYKFRNRKLGIILVSLAGPMTNFILSIIIGLIYSLNIFKGPIANEILIVALWYNIMLGVFNLLPFPPLDGSKILASLLPKKLEYKFYRYERYFCIVLLFLVGTNIIPRIMGPVIEGALNILLVILSFLRGIIYGL